MTKPFRPRDIILLVLIAAMFLPFIALKGGEGEVMIVSGNGTEYYRLDTDRVIRIESGGRVNVVRIEDKKVYMEESDCKNRLCIKTGPISRPGEVIVCIPNRVMVKIVNKDKIDGVV